MTIIVNGETQVVQAGTLADLLTVLEYEGDWLATAVNGDLVHREDRGDLKLEEGDRIEILSPMQGG
jgi:sulfur carrier protein